MGVAVDEAMEEEEESSLVEATVLRLGTSPEVGKDLVLLLETASPFRKLFQAPALAPPASLGADDDDDSSRRWRCNGVSCLGVEGNEQWRIEATEGDDEDKRDDVEHGENVEYSDVEH